ncbi:MAG: Pseudouridine synthase [Verrucomicrobiales bacterium]|nr:Pseudouridine synthase [Verrucomicrobiales bacterium]
MRDLKTAIKSNLFIYEDDHLLVVHKPAGMNTHSPAPFAGEGIYEWLRHREPRWASLAILHRLDKETSGVLVFGKTPEANRSLTAQFTQHSIEKKYLLMTDRPVSKSQEPVVSHLVRLGDKYLSRAAIAGGERAETRFRLLSQQQGRTLLEAEPITGRTHQIRVHAAENGFPIMGDRLYGGTAAARLYLHSCELTCKHPISGETITFRAEPDFQTDPTLLFRQLLIDAAATNACSLVHGAGDAHPGFYVERLGNFLLAQSANPLTESQSHLLRSFLEDDASEEKCGGVYHKSLTRHVRHTSLEESCPRLVLGKAAPQPFTIRENGVTFEMSFQEGYSVGLFLDQRDNRRRLLVDHVAAEFPVFPNGAAGSEVLNTFAYTCGFSVCAAKAGARVTSVDLSKKYLDWGRRNFLLNNLPPEQHDFIYGDTFDWIKRLAKKNRLFDAIILDPPTFSQSRQHGTFQAARDYGKLVAAALPVLKRGGTLLASTNAAGLAPEKFLSSLELAVSEAGRKILLRHYAPQPPDFRISTEEPAYLKTVWLSIQ